MRISRAAEPQSVWRAIWALVLMGETNSANSPSPSCGTAPVVTPLTPDGPFPLRSEMDQHVTAAEAAAP